MPPPNLSSDVRTEHYRIVVARCDDDDEFLNLLERWYGEGWELVSAVQLATQGVLQGQVIVYVRVTLHRRVEAVERTGSGEPMSP